MFEFQLAVFRDINSADGDKLKQNFRPVQPLQDREIFLNVPDDKSDKDLPEQDNDLETSEENKEPKPTEEPVDEKSPDDEKKTDAENDVDILKEDDDEDADTVTEAELEAMAEDEQRAEDAGSGKVEMFINFFVTVCTLSTIFIMR